MRVWTPLLLCALCLSCEYGPTAPEEPTTTEQNAVETPSYLADSARELVSSGRFDEARALLAEALSAMPEDTYVMQLLAALEMLEENYESVVDLADQGLQTEPGSIQFLEFRAEAAFRMEDVERAREGFGEVISRLEMLGRDAPNVCNPLFQCCRTADEVSIGARSALAITYYEIGDLDTAERLAREILSDRPDALPAHFVLGLVLNKRDDIAGAMREYQTVLAGCPDCAGALNNIGVLHYRMKELDSARRYFYAAYNASGFDRRSAAICWGNLADLDTLAGRFEDAEKKYLESLDMSPRWAGAWYGLAQVYHLTGREAEERQAMINGLLLDERGFTRYNAEYIEPEWEWQFNALLAEAQGDIAKARSLWRSVASGKVKMLRGPARIHLKLLQDAYK